MASYERPTLVLAGQFEVDTNGQDGPNWEWINSWGK